MSQDKIDTLTAEIVELRGTVARRPTTKGGHISRQHAVRKLAKKVAERDALAHEMEKAS